MNWLILLKIILKINDYYYNYYYYIIIKNVQLPGLCSPFVCVQVFKMATRRIRRIVFNNVNIWIIVTPLLLTQQAAGSQNVKALSLSSTVDVGSSALLYTTGPFDCNLIEMAQRLTAPSFVWAGPLRGQGGPIRASLPDCFGNPFACQSPESGGNTTQYQRHMEARRERTGFRLIDSESIALFCSFSVQRSNCNFFTFSAQKVRSCGTSVGAGWMALPQVYWLIIVFPLCSVAGGCS